MSNQWHRREESEDSERPTSRKSTRSTSHFVPGRPTDISFVGLANAFFATALYRAWNLIVLSTLWATCITLICVKVHDVSIQSTLLTVYGIVVGFTISYRTSSSFERYNEGRKLWSTIVLATRTFSRTVWFHVPDEPLPEHRGDRTDEQARAEILIEKRSVINLVEAFSVAVKHYLRGEDGIEYEDLYHLVKFLPVYTLPDAIHWNTQETREAREAQESKDSLQKVDSPIAQLNEQPDMTLPAPVTSKYQAKGARTSARPGASRWRSQTKYIEAQGPHGPVSLAPASNPPRWGVYDIWPLSLLVRPLISSGITIHGKTAARERPRENVSHNVPLQISFYLSSYIAALQRRKLTIDVPTTNLLFASLNQLVESLSGLERILTNPIPFSYGVHLWTACSIYILLMPFQIWRSFGYVTIPATTFAAFFFFGFLAAGEEIENPFGYDKNDLDLDYFCRDIIQAELAALTSIAPCRLEDWAFAKDNDHIFRPKTASTGLPPSDWVKLGVDKMREELKYDASEE